MIVTSRKLKDLDEIFDPEVEEQSRVFSQKEKVDKDVRSTMWCLLASKASWRR